MSLCVFWGYIGSGINGVLVPILIYKITGKPSLAGLALLIEWIPKLFFYLNGGRWMAKIGSQRSHYIFDSMRIVAFFCLLSAWWLQIWPLVALGAAIVQVSNALSNILFEAIVSPYELKGQVRIRQADLLSGLMMLPITFLLGTESLLILGMVLYLCSLLMIKRMGPYYRNVQSSPIPISDGLSYISAHPTLPWLILAGLSISLAGSFIGSTFPFLIKEVDPVLVAAFYISAFNFVRYITSIGLLDFFKKYKQPYVLPVTGVSVFVVGLLVTLFLPGWWMLGGILMIFYGTEFFRAWVRAKRQELTPQKGRLALTGIFASFEAISYLFAALFLALSDFPIKQSLGVVATVGVVGATLCLGVFFVQTKSGSAVWLPDSLLEHSHEKVSKAA